VNLFLFMEVVSLCHTAARGGFQEADEDIVSREEDKCRFYSRYSR
jgi:hypothetical protein